MRAEWADRDADRGARYSYTTLPAIIAPDAAELIVYTARPPAGGEPIHHGVVRRPPRLPGDVARRPVVLVLPAHGATVTVGTAMAAVPLADTIRDDCVYVIAAYRGQTLDVEGSAFTSPADPGSVYDVDADDAMALLTAVLATDFLADAGRLAVAGYDRGGTAALLVGNRFPDLDLVVSLAAPTDFTLPTVRHMARAYLLGQSVGAFPAFEQVAAAVVEPLRGGAGDLAAARLALIRRSPAHFVAPPPFVFASHGFLDGTVPVAHGRALAGIQGTSESVYLEQAEHDHGSILTSNEVISTVSSLFIERVRDP